MEHHTRCVLLQNLETCQVNSLLAYSVLYKDQWERVREVAKQNPALSVHLGRTRAIVIRNADEAIIADLGSIPEIDYYWISFSVLDEGYDLLRNAFSVDPDESVL